MRASLHLAASDEAFSTEEASFSAEQRRDISEYRERRKQGNGVKSQRPASLNQFAVFCIISNRMIGTGIFRSPQLVLRDTGSILAAVLLWVAGAIVTLAGTFVFVEFGRAIPQIPVDSQLISVPANGGEKNYLEYVVRWPKRLMTCLYGIPFILVGNMAGNTILFAQAFFNAITGREPSVAAVRGIAIGVGTLACFMHVYSRQLGIIVNNTFGSIKATLLLALVIITFVSLANGLPVKTIQDAKENYGNHAHIIPAPHGSNGYASCFLSIIFSYGGFNQANYVLGNISQPQRTFKWTTLLSVAIISALYIVLSICYYAIVPFNNLNDPHAVLISEFVARTMSSSQSERIGSAFIAFSSLGNIVIQTFTASRVKQELAKEGILPWPKFFAANRNWHWRFWQHSSQEEATGEATPVGALFLHWIFCMLFIVSSLPLDAETAYRLYVNIYSFTIEALVGFCVGSGILYLRLADMFQDHPTWCRISPENKWLSLIAALIFSLANLYPLVAIWLKPPGADQEAGSVSIPFWVTGAVGWITVGIGLLWWLTLNYGYPWLTQRKLNVERKYFTATEKGELVVMEEIVFIWWSLKPRRHDAVKMPGSEVELVKP